MRVEPVLLSVVPPPPQPLKNSSQKQVFPSWATECLHYFSLFDLTNRRVGDLFDSAATFCDRLAVCAAFAADILLTLFLSFCLSSHLLVLQEVCPEDIPIMLVGNKCDMRQDGVNSVPTSYGEKLAMVMLMLTLISFWFIPAFSHLPSRLFMLCFVLVSAHRRTTHCSVKQVPKTAPTLWKLCCTWPGEAKCW